MGENNQQQTTQQQQQQQHQQQQKTSNIMLATQEATIIDLRQQLERREQQIRTLQAQLNMYKSVINLSQPASAVAAAAAAAAANSSTDHHHLQHPLHQHHKQQPPSSQDHLSNHHNLREAQHHLTSASNRLATDQQHLNQHQHLNTSNSNAANSLTNTVATINSSNNNSATINSGSKSQQNNDIISANDEDEDDNDGLNTDGLLTSLTDAAISNLSQLAALQEQCQQQQQQQQQQHNRQSPVGSAVAAVSANLEAFHLAHHNHQIRHQDQQDALSAVTGALSSSSHTPSPIGSGLSHSHSLSSHASGLHSITPSPTSLIRTPTRRSLNTSSSLLSPSSSPGHLRRQLLPDRVPLLSPSPSSSSSLVRNTLSTPTSGGSAAASPLMGGKPNNRLNSMQIRHKFGYLGSGRAQFNRSGIFISQFGSPGKEEGQLWNPRKVAILQHSQLAAAAASTSNTSSDGPLYVVCDRGAERSRMQLFTKDGAFVKKIGIHYIDIVAGLAITQEGLIIVVDSVSPTVYIISGETGVLNGWFDCSGHMKEPSDIAVKSDIRGGNEYFICDFKGHCVVVFSEQGEYLRKIGHDGLTSYPNGIDISDDGDILVGDSHGNRFHVVVFDSHGNFVSQFECPHVKVSRCCGLKITREGYIVTLAKNNHHVLILNTLFINSVQ